MAVAFRYIARELLLLFLAVFALLLVVGLGGRFIGFLQEAAAGRFAAEVLWLVLLLRVPEFVQVTVPFAFFLALLLTFGRLHAEHEYVALLIGGASPGRIVGWLLAAAAPVAALVAALSFTVTPDARGAYAKLSLEQLADSELDAVVPGAFHVYSHGRRVTYTQEVDREANRLRGVFTAEQRGPLSVTVWAESGRQHRLPDTGSRFLELENGARYEGAPGDPNFRVVRFKRLGQRLERELPMPLEDARMSPTGALDAGDPREAAELQWRFALPLLTLIGALGAFGVSRGRPRAGRFARLLPGVGLFVAYYLLLVYAQDFVAEGVLPPALGLWWVHGLALAVAAWLSLRSARPAG